ncbi:MAG: HD domain-containing phosphohydrolase [Smithella sp.]|jgi:HD-GYP domain-containing protein (c-di-GMP phosphodiesterase class II)
MQEKKNNPDSIDADHLRRLAQIGVALSAEKDIDRLLEKILTESRIITRADGGTLYLMSDNESELEFAFVQNESLGLSMGSAVSEMTWPPVRLTNPDGSPNHANVSAHVAITGRPVNIADVYTAQNFNCEGPRLFDQKTGYRSQSMLVVPMRNHENDIIGILQLVNARDPESGRVIPFSPGSEYLALSLASQAAVSLTNNLLIGQLGNLLDAFIQTIAVAIDEKSPYTGGHVRRVADLTMSIAEKINATHQGHFAQIHFSGDELKELRMAAWLHDIGKITTPDHVVDKSTKLEKVYDRIEEIKTRFEMLKRECQRTAEDAQKKADAQTLREAEREIRVLDEECEFLVKLNAGSETVRDEMVERLRQIARRKWRTSSQALPLLTEDEIYNLSIPCGTLNDEERDIINNHAAVTHKMLSRLPFPRKLRRIAEYASAHHEKLDGSGYPSGLRGDQLFLQSRIIALADIFEALTAKDRPYKKGHTVDEALKIMEVMVRDRHIDPYLYELFIKEKIYDEYTKTELTERESAGA